MGFTTNFKEPDFLKVVYHQKLITAYTYMSLQFAFSGKVPKFLASR